MKSNLIPITRIYDIYPKYTYSNDVKKFMDEIVDIDRANVYTKDEVITMLTEIQLEIEEQRQDNPEFNIWKDGYNTANDIDCVIIQQKINALKADRSVEDGTTNT